MEKTRHSNIYNNIDQSTYKTTFFNELELSIEKEKNEQDNFNIIKKKVAEYFEGRKLRAYKDTVGKWTVGVGKNFSDVPFTEIEEQKIRKRLNNYSKDIKTLVIENGISEDECDLMFANSSKIAEKDARSLIKNFDELSDARKIALIDFSFNVGYNTMKSFKNTRKAIENEDFEKAFFGFKNSLWYKQVGRRSPIISSIIKTGDFPKQFAKSAGFIEYL